MHDLMTVTQTRIRRNFTPAFRRSDEVRAFCTEIGRLAVRSLYAEVTLYPKPGLVSLIDNGSHDDMTAATFMRSLFALRHYFVRIAKAGSEGAPFPTLKRLGLEAEQKMLVATGGINTHRGAIFCLGLLCAAIGRCHAEHIALSPSAIRAVLLTRWGEALAEHTQVFSTSNSHGLQVAAHYAASGAREEAALGLPSVFDVALPMLEQTLMAGRNWRRARVDALFALMGHISDTNVYHRGGEIGAQIVRQHARDFLRQGGTADPDWEARAKECHRIFVGKRLSPGGAADLLAAACFVYEACSPRA